jgi:trehalose synthase-fused probable maltokinase
MSAAVDPELVALEGVLPVYVAARRWFRGKARKVERCTISDAIPVPSGADRAWMAVVRISYADGANEDYALPLLVADASRAATMRTLRPHMVISERPDGGAVVDGFGDDRFLRSLLPSLAGDAVWRQGESALQFRRIGADLTSTTAEPRCLETEQSNTSIVFGEAYVLKLVRKLDEGVSADLEMGEFLTAAGYAFAPQVAGAVNLTRRNREPATLAILHRFIPNRGDAWSFFLERLTGRLGGGSVGEGVLGDDTAQLGLLAARVAEMHLALASRPDLPPFAPEPLEREERARLAEAVGASMRAALGALASSRASLHADVAAPLARVHGRRGDLEAELTRFGDADFAAGKTRVHGDLHLGQVLVTRNDFVLIDFEGEPARSLAERRAKRSPLVDVAGILRSLHYASVSAARALANPGPEAFRAALDWHDAARAAFLEAYFTGVKGAPFLPPRENDARRLLDFYLVEKCVYEVHYEVNNRPDWLAIPLAGLAQLIEGRDAA